MRISDWSSDVCSSDLPPGADILVAIDPGLAGGSVGDRRADAVAAVGIAGIIPVEALARPDLRPHRRPVVGKPEVVRFGVPEVLVAPVRQRHVIVDADRVDRRRRQETTEVDEDGAGTVPRVDAENKNGKGRW